jgi:S1-C subfamily serine protease
VFVCTVLATGCGAQTVVDHPASSLRGAPELGLVVDQRMKVLHVEAGSAAERAGIQRDDVLEAIEGVPVNAPDKAAKQKISGSQPGQKLHIRLQRKGKAMELDAISSPPPSHSGQPTPTPVLAPADYY